MPASIRDAKASSESKRSTIHSARHTTAALQEVEQQQVEHEANQVSHTTQRYNSAGHLLNYGLSTATSALQLRAQAKQCLIKHDFEQAEQLLSQGLKLTPGSCKLYRLRSVAYACLQRYKESLEVSDLSESCFAADCMATLLDAMHFVTATLDMTMSHEHALLYAMHFATATPDLSHLETRHIDI